jgi:hypothetical protein
MGADADSLEQLFWLIVTSAKMCAEARAQGVEPNEHGAEFESLASKITADTITMTLEALREGLRLRHTPQ